MTLEQLQPELYTQFQTIIRHEKLSHAYLFSGNFGSFEMALYLAQSRFCQYSNHGLPCQDCRTCRLIAQGEFSDVKVIAPTGQVIKTELVREMMREFAQSGVEGDRQVFIIKSCEKLHQNAANALLKWIEEPQSESYMILLTSDEERVLPTIKSRTQIFRFPKQESLLCQLAQEAGVLKTQALILAQLAQNPSHLEELLGQKKILDMIQSMKRLVDTMMSDKWQAYLELGYIIQLAGEKAEQELFFQLFAILLKERQMDAGIFYYLKKNYEAQQMWRSNVSFQNALDYLVLSDN